MFKPKNIYNSLNVTELNFSYNIKPFYILKDSFNNSNIFLEKSFKKLISKSIFKNSIFFSFINIQKIKFPLYIHFFFYYKIFEYLFINFFSNNLNFLLFKIYNNVYHINKISYRLTFPFSYYFKLLNFLLNYSIKFLIFRFYIKT